MASDRKTEWTPAGGEGCFATRYVPGSKDAVHPASCAPPKKPVRKRPPLDPGQYAQGVLDSDRTLLGRAITLVESNAPRHLDAAQEMLKILLPHTGNSVRLGITGYPGAGKSTFIEALGNHLCDAGHKVAVLAVDPTSSLSRGSILGDKTRMERLTRRPEAFIRPSPSGGGLGRSGPQKPGDDPGLRGGRLRRDSGGDGGRGPERGHGPLHGGFFSFGDDSRGRRRTAGHKARHHGIGRRHPDQQGRQRQQNPGRAGQGRAGDGLALSAALHPRLGDQGAHRQFTQRKRHPRRLVHGWSGSWRTPGSPACSGKGAGARP